MRTIHLEPQVYEEPFCADFTSEVAVRGFERDVRTYRAYTEPFSILPFDSRVDCTYRVSTHSGSSYLVDLVDGSGEHDTCTCPDFLGNELDCCKHVEVVRRFVSDHRLRSRARRHLGDVPDLPVLGVSSTPYLRLLPLGPWSNEQLQLHRDLLNPRIRELDRAVLGTGRLSDGIRVVRAALPAFQRIQASHDLATWRKSAKRAVAAKRIDPDVLRFPLFPYQRQGVLHLVQSGRALLADDMGLGKTVQALAACEVLRRRRQAATILVVTAASLKHQWALEIKKYTGETAAVVGGGASERRRALESGAAYTVINYELTWRELTLVQGLEPHILILDEAQRAKNFRTKTASTLRALSSRFLFILTGTPIENRLDDLYSLLQLIDPNILGPLWRFNLDFHDQNERGKITGYKNLSALRARVGPVLLRRKKEEVLLQLPERLEQTRYTPLTVEQAELEESYRSGAAQLLAIAERRPLTRQQQERLLACLLKARQACNAAELCDPKRKVKHSPKLDELEALVEEIVATGDAKVLVFSEWVGMLKLAQVRLEKMGVGYEMLHGSIPTDKRPALLQRFHDDPNARVLLSTDAGGVGLNLQVASYVIHLDLPWNPARLDQRTARAHRLGQTRGVVVTYLCAEQGIERGIEGTLAQKRKVRSAALDADSTEEALEAPSFSVFLRQLRDVLAAMGQAHHPDQDDGGELPLLVEDATLDPEVALLLQGMEGKIAEDGEGMLLPEGDPHVSAISTTETTSSGASANASGAMGATGATRVEPEVVSAAPLATRAPTGPESAARKRLRLARLVVGGGFFGDALRAAYEGLAVAVAALGGSVSTSTTDNHAALVALIYRELLPSGKLPSEAHTALARLHDLTTLERSGVAVDAALAEAAVVEAEGWILRLEAQGEVSSLSASTAGEGSASFAESAAGGALL